MTIDARPPGGAGAGPGILVDSYDVTILGVFIKTALNNGGALFGYGIHGKQAALTVKGCDFTANETADVYAENAHNALIAQCRSWGTFGRCVGVDGDSALITQVTVKHCGNDAVLVTDNAARVRKCAFDFVHDSAVENDGTDGAIEDCKATHVGNWCYRNWGIYIEGDGADVLNNKVSNNSNWEIYVDGSNALVRDNDLRYISNYGIFVSGNSSAVEDNDLQDILNYGVNIDGDDNTVRDNRIRRVSGDAIHYDGLLPRIIDNVCNEVFGNSEGISVGGTAVAGGVLRRNTVKGGGSHGILVSSDCSFFTIQDNAVEGCGGQNRDGLRIAGNSHTVSGNEAKGCSGDGFQLSGSNMIMSGNTAKKSRIDFANDGTTSSFSANSSSDGTHVVPAVPELE
ncbi:MAG: right-handed parallel beta-helix repeat-containing protein [Planctomycetes bacterium]|nr:right-handed parallel beta-helix repeat-containing protein [Planctomycetota bacterium]